VTLFLVLWACSAKHPSDAASTEAVGAQTDNSESKTPEIQASDPEKEPSRPPFPVENQTERLVKVGILEPTPKEVELGSMVTIHFRTLYPNGCWRQESVSTTTDGTLINHAYNTIYEGKGRMCTMAFKPGGFQVDVTPDKEGVWEGSIWVNDEQRASYSFTVRAP